MSAITDRPVDSTEDAMPALQLDKRQRAMLREMGIHVWTPLPQAALPELAAAVLPISVQNATDSIAAGARVKGATALIDAKNEVLTDSGAGNGAPAPFPAAAPISHASRLPPASALPTKPVGNNSVDATATSAAPGDWLVAQPQSLYLDVTGKDSAARWLVLAESSALALREAFNPLDADVGKLLDNMLRAARLHKAAAVTLVPLVRQTAHRSDDASSQASANDLQAALQTLVESTRPDVVLIMGRLASQAVLQSATAFGKLRGQVHQLQGVPAVVMQDAAFLLRTLPEKAKAWDDLCLAMSLLQKQ